MDVFTQYKINLSANDKSYLRTHSNWYKYLNRHQRYYKDFEEEMKEKYKLRTEDKLDKMNERLDAISKILDILS